MRFSPNDFIHPQDKAAREQLESIPGFSTAMKAFMHVFSEQLMHGMSMGSKIRLGPGQLPDLYSLLPPICQKLGIDEPEFYLEMSPMPNAYTYGDTRTFLTVNSGLLQLLDESELQAVLAHECGHIVCRHVLYHSMAHMLLTAGSTILGPLAALVAPVKYALLYWERRSELSADRAAAVVMSSPDPVAKTMIRLAGGPKTLTGAVNLDRYMQQADAYDKLINSSGWDKTLQNLAIMESDHPFNSVRAREVVLWSRSDEFQRLLHAMLGQQGAAGPETVCAKCGRSLIPGWKFCNNCGALLKL